MEASSTRFAQIIGASNLHAGLALRIAHDACALMDLDHCQISA